MSGQKRRGKWVWFVKKVWEVDHTCVIWNSDSEHASKDTSEDRHCSDGTTDVECIDCTRTLGSLGVTIYCTYTSSARVSSRRSTEDSCRTRACRGRVSFIIISLDVGIGKGP